MRRLIYAAPLVALAALVAAVPAADLKVEKSPTAPDTFAVVELPLEKGESASWVVYPKPAIQKDASTEAVARLHLNGPAGTEYTVIAFVTNFEAKKQSIKTETVVIGGKADPKPDPDDDTKPKPKPKPDPKPQPDPAPVAAVKRFVVVEDSAKAGPWRGDVLGSPKVAALYKAQGLSHRLIDVNADGDDPAAVAYKGLAQGKALPWLWLLDADGKIVRDLACPTDADKFAALFDAHPGERALGAILAKPKLKWAKFGESPDVPLIARDKWKPVDLSAFLPPVHDQDGRGQCASSSACSVLEWARSLAGLPYVYLSAGDLYARVNGGADNGSMPEDNLQELITNGALPVSSANPYVWNGRRAAGDAATVAARKPHRIAQAYQCDDFDALASALQQGFAVQIAIWWYDNFKPDNNGVLPRRGAGNKGGHALMAYGLTKLPDGTWALLVRNSWNTTWGVGGNCVIPESLFAGSNEFGNVWAVRSAVQSKSDFPAPKLSRVPFDSSDRFALAP